MHPDLRGERQNCSHKCVACVREKARARISRNREQYNEAARRRYAANPAKKQAANKEWDVANPDKRRAIRLAWLKRNPDKANRWANENPERHRELTRRWQAQNRERHEEARKKWREENRPKVAAKDARRRATEKAAMPAQMSAEDKARIEDMYRQARRLGMTVDHIVPIAGCRCCGARGTHEPDNLQLMPSGENKAKRDRCQTCWEKSRATTMAAAA